ncbi:MAG: adenylate/guanylate cyclase domain-containing protein [Spirochaetes bacterium]|nr:MAG: adenylate/guanylate cyclase domain-containing protein [Spirochaetota bacterium]
MSIKTKIILVVLPLLVASMIITATISFFSARSGITRIAISFMSFKSEELLNYADNQWNLLVANGLSDQETYVEAAKKAVESYAKSIVKSKSELIFALDQDSRVVLASSDFKLGIEEKSALFTNQKDSVSGWQSMTINQKKRVGYGFTFEPFNWYILVTEEEEAFYKESRDILNRTAIVLGVTIFISVLLLIYFSGFLTRPLTKIVLVMRKIITTSDMSERVPVEYKDEIGALAHTFNIMAGELEKAYSQIKQFAFQTVIAQRNEHKVRNIFQKYVPKDVIDTIFENPEKMLVGDNRVVAILFSDIRSFTTISEGYMPDELVSVLNRYFELMVDIIISHNGVIDKYIGDAIMAFFGAPVKHPDDAVEAVYAAIEMQDALLKFNNELIKNGKTPFKTGIGVNYGVVTVGNIGSEKKMDYTIIGDMVNLGSRLEGLTKPYHQDVIFSESVSRKIAGKLPVRMLDIVQVKGKTKGESIFTAKQSISPREEKGWAYHEAAMKLYYKREFKRAAKYFMAVQKLIPNDYIAGMYIDRCKKYLKTPPPADWNGIEILTSK